MQLTEQTILAIAPTARKTAAVYVPYLNETMERYHITTLIRAAIWLAQIMHESGAFRYTRELASGSAYEGRDDLGNIHPGDGVKFRGRGLIQVTGRANYEMLSKDLDVDFIADPSKLELPEWAALSAGWFWDKKKLNSLADKNEFKEITRRINGGYNGLASRLYYYHKSVKALQPLFAA